MKLPMPGEWAEESVCDGDTRYIQEHLYWNLAKGGFQIENLLLEIIKSDIGGISALCSNVYFVNAEHAVLYYLYDDRSADIAARDRAQLQKLYQKYGGWILPYDRDRIDRLFLNRI